MVYDLTNFANEHPGGPQILVNRAGKIATEAFKYYSFIIIINISIDTNIYDY